MGKSRTKQCAGASVKVKQMTHKYVFKDSGEINDYLVALNNVAGPVHSTMAMIRCALAARTYQVQHLQRKHLDLGASGSRLFLLPMKGHGGEWADLPDCLRQRFVEASLGDGIRKEIQRKSGNRPATKYDVVFKLPGGRSGLGDLERRDDYVFCAVFSGRDGVIELQLKKNVVVEICLNIVLNFGGVILTQRF